ncbi:hypothetical protein FACS189494_00530 [Spirochaetia bacterium]|nr:hypothetical protein FACS189494_00530 [Spirochaetia bacterium]
MQTSTLFAFVRTGAGTGVRHFGTGEEKSAALVRDQNRSPGGAPCFIADIPAFAFAPPIRTAVRELGTGRKKGGACPHQKQEPKGRPPVFMQTSTLFAFVRTGAGTGVRHFGTGEEKSAAPVRTKNRSPEPLC